MRRFTLAALAALPLVQAVFRDEVGHIDFFHELLGVPQVETTFFHRPRLDDKASLLYTLSDVGVLGAVNPSSGDVVWRQWISGNMSNGGGHLRAGDGESWLASAHGDGVHAWSAVNGRNIWSVNFPGLVKDLEIMEMTENGQKDVLALFQEDTGVVLRRMHATEGTVMWEFRETSKDRALQVSTNVEKVFVVSLHGGLASTNLKISVLDTLTGKRVDEIMVGVKGDVASEKDVHFVGANSAAPIVAWTDDSLTKLRINVLGTKNKQEFPLVDGTIAVEIHAPHLVQSQPHFLVHSRTVHGSRAEVYHIDLKSNDIKKAYDLPHVSGHGAFSTSSIGANVYFARVTEDQISLTDSTSHGVLGRWPLKAPGHNKAVHAVAEVLKKSGDQYAIRSALTVDSGDWALVQNGNLAWVRPESMSGAVAASFAEIAESENLARVLEQEAHSNPLSAYVHRVKRQFNDTQYLGEWIRSIPPRLTSSILGTEMSEKFGLHRDTFGFHKLVVLATRRGRVIGLDAGNHGKVMWNIKAFELTRDDPWVVKGIHVDDTNGHATIRGGHGEFIVLKTQTGEQITVMPKGAAIPVEHTALVDTESGPWLLPIGPDGKVDDIPKGWLPRQMVVVRGEQGHLRGLRFASNNGRSVEEVMWEFVVPSQQRVVHVATRPRHEPVASIGRVLGDRSVLYKYLNPNTVLIAAVDETASTLTTYLLDTLSGEVLSSSTHEGVDTRKPVECVMSENWFACTFFGQYKLRDNAGKSIRGHQISVSDLYESALPNDRGPLGDAANFSSIHPIETPSGLVLPHIVSQSWIISNPISKLTVTQTKQGISTRHILAYLPESHGILGLPRAMLEPRRPVGRDPNAEELEEGLVKYAPNIEVDPKLLITHERDVIGVQGILATPTNLESTGLVFAFGIDIFGSRVAPSFTFDILGKGFNKVALIGTVVALFAGVFMLGPMVRRKQIDARWRSV